MLITDKMTQLGESFVELIYRDAFIQGMMRGNLEKEAVRHYLKADSIYLKKFSDIYAMLLSRVEDIESKQFFLSQIDFILNTEVTAHHVLADYVGEEYSDIVSEGDWYPSSDHYVKHMYYQLTQRDVAFTLAAMFPCPWIYKRVAEEVLKRETIANDNPFKAWLEFYAGELMDHCLGVYSRLIEEFAVKASEGEKKELVKVFLESCYHERQFFQMSVEQEEWPEEVRYE